MWIGIVGSRDFGACPCKLNDKTHAKPGDCPRVKALSLVLSIINRWATKPDFEGTVSGGAAGADTWCKEASDLLGVTCREFKVQPGPESFGVRAFKRNKQIVQKADVLIALYAPGPRSNGTTNSVTLAREKGIPVHIFHRGRWTTE